MRIVYFIAGVIVCIGAVSEGIHANLLGAFGLTLVGIILFQAAFKQAGAEQKGTE